MHKATNVGIAVSDNSHQMISGYNLKNKIDVMQKSLDGKHDIYVRVAKNPSINNNSSWNKIYYKDPDDIDWEFDVNEYKAELKRKPKPLTYETDLLGKKIWYKDDSTLASFLIVAQDGTGVYAGNSPFVIEYDELSQNYNIEGINLEY